MTYIAAVFIAAAANIFTVTELPHFSACDGYESPRGKGDGITTEQVLLGLASSATDARRKSMEIGAGGLVACDQALSDPALKPEFFLRRAHLLQAKALHLIATGKYKEAIETLSASDAAAPAADLDFQNSVGLGNRALRAYALINLGRGTEASEQLDAIEKARPYANQLMQLSRSIRLLAQPTLANQQLLDQAAAVLNPDLIKFRFKLDVLYGRFEDAAAIYDEISFDLPRGREEWTIQGFDDDKYQLIAERADFRGGMAYALAALGKHAESATLIEKARAEIALATQRPPAPADGRPLSRAAESDYQHRLSSGETGSASLKRWAKAIELRKNILAVKVEDVNRILDEAAETDVFRDLVDQLPASTPEDKAAKAAFLTKFDSELDQVWRKRALPTIDDIAKLLPRPETPKSKPKFKRAGDGFFFDDHNGFYVKRNQPAGATSVRFGSLTAPIPTVEELTVYAAANQARNEGKDSFLINSRMVITRTTRIVSPYSSGTPFPTGYEVRMVIVPIDAASLPSSRKWRAINAQQVLDALSPRYGTAGARSELRIGGS